MTPNPSRFPCYMSRTDFVEVRREADGRAILRLSVADPNDADVYLDEVEVRRLAAFLLASTRTEAEADRDVLTQVADAVQDVVARLRMDHAITEGALEAMVVDKIADALSDLAGRLQ